MRRRSPVAVGVLIALAVIGILAFLYLIYKVSIIITILLLSAIIAAGIAPMVDAITRLSIPPRGWHLPKGVAVVLVYLSVLIIACLLVVIVGSVVVRESLDFAEHAPTYYSAVQGYAAKLHAKYSFLPDLPAVMEKIRSQIGTIGSYLYKGATRLFGFFGNIVVLLTTFVIVFYTMTSEHSIKDAVLRFIPPSQREKYGETFAEMGKRMGAWLRAQVVLALIVGAVISFGLWILGVEYALIIGVIGAIAEMLPMLGPGVAAIPAVGIALFSGKTWQVVVVIVFFVVLSQFESNILFPRIMKHHVGLNPVLTILALLAGFTLAGFLGALLAIPLMAALQVFFGRIILPAIEEAEREDSER